MVSFNTTVSHDWNVSVTKMSQLKRPKCFSKKKKKTVSKAIFFCFWPHMLARIFGTEGHQN